MKHVIHIFGASGSGTSTLGKKICDELGYTFMDTDSYYWIPTDPKFIQKRPVSERIEMMREDIMKAGNVVLSGSLTDWGDCLIPYFTLAIRIDMEQELRIQRLRQREAERFGCRIEAGGDMYQQHLEFVEWAKSYDTAGVEHRSKAKHDEWQKLLSCPLLRLDGADLLENKLNTVKEFLGV